MISFFPDLIGDGQTKLNRFHSHRQKNVAVLNRVTRSEHMIVRAKLKIDVGKDIVGFQRCITDILNGTEAAESINVLNEIITSAMLERQNKYCSTMTKRHEGCRNGYCRRSKAN